MPGGHSCSRAARAGRAGRAQAIAATASAPLWPLNVQDTLNTRGYRTPHGALARLRRDRREVGRLVLVQREQGQRDGRAT